MIYPRKYPRLAANRAGRARGRCTVLAVNPWQVPATARRGRVAEADSRKVEPATSAYLGPARAPHGRRNDTPMDLDRRDPEEPSSEASRQRLEHRPGNYQGNALYAAACSRRRTRAARTRMVALAVAPVRAADTGFAAARTRRDVPRPSPARRVHEAAPVSRYRQDPRGVPWLRRGPHQAAMRGWSRPPIEHAVANTRGGEEERQDRAGDVCRQQEAALDSGITSP